VKYIIILDTNTFDILICNSPNNSNKGPFGSQNTPLEWNGYSYGMLILLFGKGLFLGIVISMGITNPLHIGIVIPLKNERNSYF
jgi:hypothetical protein